ncbi:MAG: carboxymuconolactone decarboxylase [Frankiales bacterium]|nr:carboxymuconolactone decarboxylase [Frankiales bacterium]
MRLHQVTRAEATSPVVTMIYDHLFEGRCPVEQPGTATGTNGDWWTVFANSPDVLEHAVKGFLLYQSPDRELPPLLRELAQTRIGFAAGSGFVSSQHVLALRNLGETEERIKAVETDPTSELFTSTEQHLLRFADHLVHDHGSVPDEVFEPLSKELGDVAMLELTYIAAMYLMQAVMSKALRTEGDA